MSDRCGQRTLPTDKPCRKKGIITVPTGYGRNEEMCLDCARVWADAHLERFNRMAAFYKVLEGMPKQQGLLL